MSAAAGGGGGAAAAVAAASNFVEVPSAVFYKTYTAATLEALTVEAHDLINETLEAVPVTTNRMDMGSVSFELEPMAASHRLVLRATGNPAWILMFARIAKGAGWKQEKHVSLFKYVTIRETPSRRMPGFNTAHWLDPAANRSGEHGPLSEHPLTAGSRIGRLSRGLFPAEAEALAADPGAALPAAAIYRHTLRRYGGMPRQLPNAAADAVYRRFRSDRETVEVAKEAARAAALAAGATEEEAVAAAEKARLRVKREHEENAAGGPAQRRGGARRTHRRTVKRRKQ